jgi:hypothetical protein
MLILWGALLICAAYLLFLFTSVVCQRRPASFWASETVVLVFLAPAMMVLFVVGCAVVAKFWVDGGFKGLDEADIGIGAASIVLVVIFGYLSSVRLKRPRAPAA